MRRIRCIAASAEGGFKIINGPPEMGKGPMTSKEVSDTSNKASPPQPTQAGRIETCTELIRQAMKCLENNDKQCTMRLVEELVRNQCHDGRLIGKEVADKVKDLVHDLWLVSNNEYKCELLRMLKDLGISRNWVRDALHGALNTWFVRCGVDWEGRAMRIDITMKIEDLLRRMDWSEVRMCEEMWRFIGVDVDKFRRYGIEPCIWLEGLKLLRDLRNPYWYGLRVSDLAMRRRKKGVELKLKTTNTIDAVFFPILLNTVKTPSPEIEWGRIIPGTRHAIKPIALSFYVDLGIDEWPWPIEFSADELEKILNNLSDAGLTMFVAGAIDGDGTVWCMFEDSNVYVYVEISACKKCHKSYILNALRRIIAERFGIIGNIHLTEKGKRLLFSNENAVRLLRRVVKYIHHPLRRLRAELILALYDRRISREAFEKLYEMTEYELGGPDIKHNHGLEAIIRAAPQTHTHGDKWVDDTNRWRLRQVRLLTPRWDR